MISLDQLICKDFIKNVRTAYSKKVLQKEEWVIGKGQLRTFINVDNEFNRIRISSITKIP
jgi:hypothetical protein